jgi:hypothetical protein
MKELFDGMIKSNQDIYSKMGTSGLFAGGQTGAAQAFQNVRTNLTPGVNMYGQTQKINYEMVAAINKFGVGVSDLSDANNDLTHNIIGRAGGPVGGGIASTVFGGARLAGLDTPQAVETIMKLLQQYHLSLEQTDSFFNKLNIDIKAAGLTSIKYIQILDEISGQFTHMARGVDTVTGALRGLGHTGLLTVEQLEDTMKGLFATKTTPEMGAYILSQMPQGVKDVMTASAKEGVDRSAQSAYDSLRDVYTAKGLGREDAEKYMKEQGIGSAQDLIESEAARQRARQLANQEIANVGTERTGLVGTAIGQLTAGLESRTTVGNFGQDANIQNAIQLSHMINMPPAVAASLNLGKVSAVLAMVNRSAGGKLGKTDADVAHTFMTNPGLMGNYELQQRKFSEEMQLPPEFLNDVRSTMGDLAATWVNDLKSGKLGDEQYKKAARYTGVSVEDLKRGLPTDMGLQAKAEEGWKTDFLGNMADAMLPGGKLWKELEESNKTEGERLKETMADSLGKAMTTSDDYLSQIKDILEMKVYGILTSIGNAIDDLLVVFHISHRASAEDQAEVAKEIAKTGPDSYRGSLETLEQQEKDLTDAMKRAKDNPTMLASLTARRDDLTETIKKGKTELELAKGSASTGERVNAFNMELATLKQKAGSGGGFLDADTLGSGLSDLARSGKLDPSLANPLGLNVLKPGGAATIAAEQGIGKAADKTSSPAAPDVQVTNIHTNTGVSTHAGSGPPTPRESSEFSVFDTQAAVAQAAKTITDGFKGVQNWLRSGGG